MSGSFISVDGDKINLIKNTIFVLAETKQVAREWAHTVGLYNWKYITKLIMKGKMNNIPFNSDPYVAIIGQYYKHPDWVFLTNIINRNCTIVTYTTDKESAHD